jgi:hypothetical protein
MLKSYEKEILFATCIFLHYIISSKESSITGHVRYGSLDTVPPLVMEVINVNKIQLFHSMNLKNTMMHRTLYYQ